MARLLPTTPDQWLNYIVNTGPESAVQGLESKPQLAFALCYVAAHLVLDLVDERTAAEVMGSCDPFGAGEWPPVRGIAGRHDNDVPG